MLIVIKLLDRHYEYSASTYWVFSFLVQHVGTLAVPCWNEILGKSCSENI